jgi:hypothetical protein
MTDRKDTRPFRAATPGARSPASPASGHAVSTALATVESAGEARPTPHDQGRKRLDPRHVASESDVGRAPIVGEPGKLGITVAQSTVEK